MRGRRRRHRHGHVGGRSMIERTIDTMVDTMVDMMVDTAVNRENTAATKKGETPYYSARQRRRWRDMG